MASTQSAHIGQILKIEPENCEKSAVKYCMEKPILLNFVNLF